VLHRFGAFLLFGWVLALVGCGGTAVFAPPPVGMFSNASLKGAYAFAVSGVNSFGFFSIAGSLQADGNGNITAGVEDVNSASGVFPNLAITGKYTISADGRGTATLFSSLNPVNIDFVLVSGQHALVIRFDNNATASGTMDLQDSSAFSTNALQGAFAFDLFGIDGVGNTLATAGMFSSTNSGSLTGGTEDFNDNGAVSANLALIGSLNLGSADGRGIAALTTSLGTLDFAFYVVDANHLKLVEIDSTPVLAGDAFRQQGTFSNGSLSGAYPFTLGGSSLLAPFAAGGIFTADGNGNIVSGVEDINNNGSVAQNLSLSGGYSIASNGRGTLTLTNAGGSSHFVIYPSTGGIQMLEIDSTVISSGSALAQQGAAFSNASIQGNYGLNFTGVTIGGEIDAIAQFSADGDGHLKGTVDFNNTGALSLGLALNGSYSGGANGRATATLNSSAGTLNMALYIVNNSLALALDLDQDLVAVGSFQHQ
jgi:hypothetical protein